jgi:hypothetical protein
MNLEREIISAAFNRPQNDYLFLNDLKTFINPKIKFKAASNGDGYKLQIKSFDVEQIVVVNNIGNRKAVLGINAIDEHFVIYECLFFLGASGKIYRVIIRDPFYDKYSDRYNQEFKL